MTRISRSSLLALCIAALVLGVSACGGSSSDEPATETAEEPTIPFEREGQLAFIQDGDSLVTIDIEIADTDSARTRGLMQRDALPEKSGMLFIFPQEQNRSFWMANTPLALDIIFVSADSQIVSIAKYTTPFSSENVPSKGPSKYVVEVPAGFTDSYGLAPGDRIRWTRDGSS